MADEQPTEVADIKDEQQAEPEPAEPAAPENGEATVKRARDDDEEATEEPMKKKASFSTPEDSTVSGARCTSGFGLLMHPCHAFLEHIIIYSVVPCMPAGG